MSMETAHFCLKYNRLLRTMARPEEARTGSLNHPTVFDMYWFTLSILNGWECR